MNNSFYILSQDYKEKCKKKKVVQNNIKNVKVVNSIL